MRKSALVLLAIVSLARLVAADAATGDAKAGVRSVIDAFPRMFETKDLDLFDRSFAHDAAMVSFGTDAGERFVGYGALRSSLEQQFKSFATATVAVRDQVIQLHGDVAWFSEVADWDLVADGKPVRLEGFRMTGVLEKQHGQWRFVQFHASLPVSGQAVKY